MDGLLLGFTLRLRRWTSHFVICWLGILGRIVLVSETSLVLKDAEVLVLRGLMGYFLWAVNLDTGVWGFLERKI